MNAAIRAPDFYVADEPCAGLGDDPCLLVTNVVHARLRNHVHLDLDDARQSMFRAFPGGFERHVARFLTLERRLKTLIDVTQDIVARTKVRRDALPGNCCSTAARASRYVAISAPRNR
jgi:hypothetical protein